jgi:hypothetical protein
MQCACAAICLLLLCRCWSVVQECQRWLWNCRFTYGEGTYAEIFGDITSGYLPPQQLDLARRVHAIAKERGVPLIGIYIGGRDRLVSAFDALFAAHLLAFYPGPYGGRAISKVLRGVANPSARLPITMHATDMQTLPYWRAPSDYTTIPPALIHTRCTTPTPLLLSCRLPCSRSQQEYGLFHS